MKPLIQWYKKANNEMSRIADIKEVLKHVSNLPTVPNLSNKLTMRTETMEERNKKENSFV